MSSKRYTVLGYVVWKGARWYLRRRYGSRITAGRVAAAGGAAAAASIGVAVAVMARRRRA